ncbi:MAG: transposase [Terriglobia bacterium]
MRDATQANTQPRRKRIRLPADAYYKPGTWYFVTICCRNKEALFQPPEVRHRVKRALCATATESQIELAAYTILPNHVHIVCSAGPLGLPRFIRAFKGRVAADFRRRFGGGSPWQARYFDHKIRSEESLEQKCRYVWLNPVRRRLAGRPEDYSWSGALLSG